MKRLNKILYAAVMILFLVVQGCSSGSSDDDDEPPVPVQPGDNVVFSNQTEFAVKVYSDSMRSVLVTDVAAKGSVSLHVDVVAAGNVFYFSYFMDVNGVSVPYSVTDGQMVLLNDSSATSVKITDPESVNTKNRIILLKNEASSAIVLNNGNKEEIPEGKSSALINSGDYGVYMLKVTDAVENIRVSEGTKSVALSTAADFENGYIYTIVYDGTKIYMRSKSFLDRNMNKKIWKIGVSQEAGKTLVTEKLLTSGNQNGYVLYGRIGYDRNLAQEEAVSYYAYVESTGEIAKENSFAFIDKPKCAAFIDVVEGNGIILALMEKISSAGIKSYSIVSDSNGYSINKTIVQDDDTVFYYGMNILQKKDNVFCVLLENNDNIDGTHTFCRYELLEISVDNYSSVSTKKLCESDDSAFLSPVSFAYDSATDTYIVMSQPVDNNYNNLQSTQVSFIDGTTGDIKINDLKIDKHLFNKVKVNPGDGYAYASGSFINQLTGKDIASFVKIDILTGTMVGGKPAQYPCSDSSLNSNFNDFVIDGDTIILGGYTDADYGLGENTNVHPSMTTCPFVVSYNIKEAKTIYEREYEDLNGFEILGINFSSIGSLLLDIFSYNTSEGYIASTGLLGELPKTTKLTLPQSTSIKPIDAPSLTIEFHKDYSSDDAYNETSFKYGTTITMADLEQYADATAGYSVVGWYDRNNNEEDVEISVPFVITEKMKLYPKFKISPPTGVCGWATSDSEIYVQWDAHPVSQSYYLYWRDNYGNSGGTPVSNAASCTISGLNSGTSYTIEVIAYDNSKAEWSERSAECTIQTETATNWGDIPSYAEELPLNTGGINTHVYLNPGDVHYYYAYFEAGRSYCVWWADSYEGMEYLEDWELTPCADAAVSVYYAGDAEADFIDSGYIVPYEICCSRSGYYLIELRGFSSDAKGWCAITCYEKIE